MTDVDPRDRSPARSPRRTRRRASRRASRPSASCSTHMLREVRPDIPVLFLDTFHHFAADAGLPRRAGRALGAEPDQPARGRAAASGCGRPRAPRPAARGTRSEPLFSALEGYDTWFTALRRDQSPSRANLQEVEAVPAAERQDDLAQSAPLAGVDGAGRLELREASTTSRCCRSTSWATRASAASRARPCRSIRTTRARAAGRARSSSAGFTFSRWTASNISPRSHEKDELRRHETGYESTKTRNLFSGI